MTGLKLDDSWQSVLEAAPISFALLDHERRIRYINRAGHGFDRNALLGTSIDDVLPATERARITRLIDDVLRTGAPHTYETRLLTPAGLVIFFVRLNALVTAGARYVVLVSFDITEEHEKHRLREREHALLIALEPVNRLLLSAPMTEATIDRLPTADSCLKTLRRSRTINPLFSQSLARCRFRR